MRKKFRNENLKIVTIPNILTFGRIIALPFLVISFFMKKPIGDVIAMTIFVLASLTDYADGYIARKFKQSSKFGSFLDPIADKLLITVTLFMLAGFGRIDSYNLIPAVLIVCRELIVSGLREFLGAMGLDLPVLKLAKYKTTIQMFAIIFLLFNFELSFSNDVIYIGFIMLWVASILTIITGIKYVSISMTFIKLMQKKGLQILPNNKSRKVRKSA